MASLTVARVAGVPVRLHASLLLALPLFAYVVAASLLAPEGGPPDAHAWSQASLLAFALLAGVALHEAAHAWVACQSGLRVRSVLLLPVGGVTSLERAPRDPRLEWRVAAAGPLASLALGMLLLGLAPHLGELARWAGWLNVGLGVANLALPAHPMDGGRILRALLAPRIGRLRAAWVCARAGAAGALALCLWGILTGAWLLLALAAFLHFGARHEEQTATLAHVLGRVRVGDVMARPSAILPADATLAAARERMAATGQRALPVAAPGAPAGLLLLQDVERVAPEDRAWTPAGMLARRVPTFAPWDDGGDAARRLGPGGVGLVRDAEGRLVGVVAGADLARVVGAADPAPALPEAGRAG